MPRTEDETEVSFLRRLQLCVATLCGMLALAVAGPAQAETGEVRAAQQFGLSYLALMIMEDSRLIEKQAKACDNAVVTFTGDLNESLKKVKGASPVALPSACNL